MDREKWLAERKKGIGGSDAAAIVGLTPYATPYTVWADKTGRLPEREDNEAMRQGRDLEDYVAKRFTEKTGKKVRRNSKMLHNPLYPFALANIDRDIVGENAGFEAKTTSVLNLKKFKNGEYPENYYVQCVHYLAVSGYKRWYLGVLVLNQGFYDFVIERDQDEIDALMSAEGDFWNGYVVTDTPPPMDGHKPTSDALSVVYEKSVDAEVKALFRSDIIQNYNNLKEQIAALEAEKEKCEQILKQDLGEAEYGACGNFLIEWKGRSRSTFDYKAFRADNPSVDMSDYFKTTNFRKFTVKEQK